MKYIDLGAMDFSDTVKSLRRDVDQHNYRISKSAGVYWIHLTKKVTSCVYLKVHIDHFRILIGIYTGENVDDAFMQTGISYRKADKTFNRVDSDLPIVVRELMQYIILVHDLGGFSDALRNS